MILAPRFSDQKVLVTGASGFIGSHLLRRLGEIGAGELHAVSRMSLSDARHAARWWRVDLTEITTVQDVLKAIKPDVIFHVAGRAAGARSLDLVMPTFQSNLMSTVNLLTVATEIGCRRIVLTGSSEEPELGNAEPIPSSPYAVSKWAESAYARMFCALYQLPVVILRVFMVYGPAQRDLRKVIPYVILSLARREAPRLGSGQRLVDWIYIDDVIDAYLAAGTTEGLEGNTVDVGSGNLVSIRRVVDHLVRLIDPQIVPIFGALPDRSFEQERVADTARSNAVMDWRPVISLEEGLKRTVDWYALRLREHAL